MHKIFLIVSVFLLFSCNQATNKSDSSTMSEKSDTSLIDKSKMFDYSGVEFREYHLVG